jgi:hypothetical protein
MAFTNAWSNTTPAGSAAANTIDDAIQQLRLDVDERMDKIVTDWSADPLFTLTGLKKTIHWSAGNGHWNLNDNALGDWTGAKEYIVPGNTSNALHWLIPIYLPNGATLQSVIFRVNRVNASASIAVWVYELDDTPSTSTLGSTSSATTGWEDLSVSSLAATIDDDKSYHAYILLTSDGATASTARLAHITVTYDLSYALQGVGL